jgi:predicted RecA/RadA family phage recombinase
MAVFEQVAGSAVDGGDIYFKNYGGSAIPAFTAVKIDSSNATSATAPPGVVQTTDDTNAIGFALESIPAGKSGRVRCYGVAVAIAGAAITVGTYVMTNSSGQVVAQTAGKFGIGYAIRTASASTENVPVLIMAAKNA